MVFDTLPEVLHVRWVVKMVKVCSTIDEIRPLSQNRPFLDARKVPVHLQSIEGCVRRSLSWIVELGVCTSELLLDSFAVEVEGGEHPRSLSLFAISVCVSPRYTVTRGEGEGGRASALTTLER